MKSIPVPLMSGARRDLLTHDLDRLARRAARLQVESEHIRRYLLEAKRRGLLNGIDIPDLPWEIRDALCGRAGR
jgi:hypothetical protein